MPLPDERNRAMASESPFPFGMTNARPRRKLGLVGLAN
jgi:hypothetical protein